MKASPRLFLVLLAAAALLSGCGTPQISRIDRNRDIYESWPIETRQAVLDGKVEQGMTEDMVRVAWGEPTQKVTSPSDADEEIWIYRKGGEQVDPMMYPGPMSPSGGIMGAPVGIGMGGPGIGIATGRGGTGVFGTGGIGIGGGMGGPVIGGGAPVMAPSSTPVEEKEVVFRNGVVYRADQP